MKKKSRVLYRISSLLLMLLMVVSVFCTIPLMASAAIITSPTKSYDIAVVLDNSGSMYQPDDNGDSKAWCRAKYAMEIFASMLNYENGDKLIIYPMWEVTTDGSQPDSGGSYSAIEIKSKADIDKISKLYTVHPNNTPFAPVLEANDYLKTSSATEKWIIVLTDGTFNQIERGKSVGTISSADLKKRLLNVATDGIKVQYLGFAGASKLDSEESKNFYAKKSSNTSLKDDLIGICNSIFQRSILPANRLNAEKLNLDLSMKNVIVFAQGANAKITSLKDSSGKEVAVSLDSGQRKYSDIKAKGYSSAQVDTTLAGQVVTFTACPKGEYTLSYSGADKIQIFYEPDVDINISFTNSDGQKIEKPEDFVAGEYTVNSRIVDASTHEDVTSHELMGKDVKLSTYVKTSKDSERKEYANGSKIAFKPDDSTEIWVEGEYLGKYKISSKDDKKWDWLCKLKVKEPAIDFKINASAEQTWYKLKYHDEWKPIRVALTIDGQPLTEKQLASTKFTVAINDGLKYRIEEIPGESAYNIFLSQDETGKYIEPEIGKYKLTATATYVDEYDKGIKAPDESVEFEIAKYGAFLSWLLRNLWWILLIIVLFLLWLFYMTRKVLPKKLVKDNARFNSISAGDLDGGGVDVRYNPKSKSLKISGPTSVEFDEQCAATFTLKPLDNRFTASNRRRFAVINISSQCEELKLGATPYVNFNGKWIKKTELRAANTANFTPKPLYQEMSANPKFTLFRVPNGVLQSTLNCDTKTKK